MTDDFRDNWAKGVEAGAVAVEFISQFDTFS